jgi:hypothetical protein
LVIPSAWPQDKVNAAALDDTAPGLVMTSVPDPPPVSLAGV